MYLTVSTVTSPANLIALPKADELAVPALTLVSQQEKPKTFLEHSSDFSVKEAAVVVVAVKGALARCLKHCDHFREVRIGRVAGSPRRCRPSILRGGRWFL